MDNAARLLLPFCLALPAWADVPADRAAELQRLVQQDCGSCHGLALTGGLGRAITPNALLYWDRTLVAQVILDGLPGTAMPGWRPLLTEDEALWIADYLKAASE